VLEAARWLAAHRQEALIEQELATLRAVVLDAVRPWHAQRCADLGHHETTVLIPTLAGVVQVIFANAWKKIDAGRADDLEAELGTDVFRRCFREAATVNLKKQITDDPQRLNQIVRELANLIGEKFLEWFECEAQLVPNDEFLELQLDAAALGRLGLEQLVKVQEQRRPAGARQAA
jgi:hypothetical protein